MQICRDVNKAMARLKKNLPADINIEVVYDSSEEIQNSINGKESLCHAQSLVRRVIQCPLEPLGR